MDITPQSLVVVANRLPVDAQVTEGTEGRTVTWRPSPGGLVTAMDAVMRSNPGAWVGWCGTAGLELDPFTDDSGRTLVPIPLSATDLEEHYEGFSNASLWPLYHDGVAPPEYHREWWATYEEVNRRFADAAAAAAAEGATVWVHDYQLQLVPAMLRAMRPDLRIGFFLHIPFPPYEIFRQIPWRRQILEGLLGSDLIGFQRKTDASNFRRTLRMQLGMQTQRTFVKMPGTLADEPERLVRAEAYPISIDSADFEALARSPEVQDRAAEIRRELGNPDLLMLGVDRLDYTKGIRHRLRAIGELLDEGELDPTRAVLVQVASPSRGRVELYQAIRDDIESTVGRINGSFATIGHNPVIHLHQPQPREEIVALYLAADLMLVTALRDGMNLVAKEYVASRFDGDGVLVLSEFAGAADELTQAVAVNPYDIDGLKAAIMQAVTMDRSERRRRMRFLRRRVMENDVQAWAHRFLDALTGSET